MGGLSEFLLTHPVWGWMAAGALFLILEVITGSGWLLWPAASAFAVGLASVALPLGAAQAMAAFGVMTIVTTYVGRRYLTGRRPVAPDVNDPLERLVGHRGEAVTAFEGETGRVFVDGKEWAALLEGPGPLGVGAKVQVVEVLGGARLKVRPA